MQDGRTDYYVANDSFTGQSFSFCETGAVIRGSQER